MNKEVINMRIEGTHLGLDNRNRFTFTLSLSDDDGSGCGFGGWSLGRAGSDMLRAVLETVGTDSWETLPGKYVRVVFEDERSVAIGHITKNKWLNLTDWMDAWKAEHGPEVPEK